jgi:glutamate dehydrogenase
VVEVVTDDMPFLVQSLLAAVARLGADVQRVIHPIVVVRRDADGRLVEVLAGADPAAPPDGAVVESWVHLDLTPTAVPGELVEVLQGALAQVREVVDDGDAMLAAARRIADGLPAQAPPEASVRPTDVARLLRWLADGHLTFLGYRRYTADAAGHLSPDPGSGLGVLRSEEAAARLAPVVDSAPGEPDLLVGHPRQRRQPAAPRAPLLPRHRRPGRRRPAGRRAPVPRPAHRAGPVRERARHPGDRAAGARRDPPRRVPAGELLGPADARGHLRPAARGAVQRRCRAAARHRGRGAGGVRTARGAPVREPRPVPPVRVLPGLPAPRPVHDVVAPGDGRGAARPARRHLGRPHRAGVGGPAGAGPVHRPRPARRPGFGPLDVEALQDELTEAVRTWDDRLVSAAAGSPVTALLAGVPETYKAAVDPADAPADLERIAALQGPATSACGCTPPGPTASAGSACTWRAGPPR